MKIFIGGPMTGLESWNFPAFHKAEIQFTQLGWDVLNPARLFDINNIPSREDSIRLTMRELLSCDALALLPGWRKSSGTANEVFMAKQLGLQFYDAITLQPMEAPNMYMLKGEEE